MAIHDGEHLIGSSCVNLDRLLSSYQIGCMHFVGVESLRYCVLCRFIRHHWKRWMLCNATVVMNQAQRETSPSVCDFAMMSSTSIMPSTLFYRRRAANSPTKTTRRNRRFPSRAKDKTENSAK